MRVPTITVLFFGLLIVGLGPHRAVAQTDSVADPFSESVREAMRFYDAQDYQHALTELQRAYKLKPWPRLHYNMARCHEHMGEQREEYNELSLYLKTDPNIGYDTARLTRVQAKVDKLRHELGLDISEGPKLPLYKRWWLWSTIGSVVAVAAAVAGTYAAQAAENTPIGTQFMLIRPTSMAQTAGFHLRW